MPTFGEDLNSEAMKQSKKEQVIPGQSDTDSVLQGLYDENKALTKLMQQLEIRSPLSLKMDTVLKPERGVAFTEE